MSANPADRPQRDEAPDYYFRYIDLVPPGDICVVLDRQRGEMGALLEAVPESRWSFRYAPEKWTLREVLAHLNDTERVFASRAHWIARGFESPLPSFDQDVAVRYADANARPLPDHVEEFGAIRASSLHLFTHLSDEAWSRRGTASGVAFSVRALAHILAGHVEHHRTILRARYLS